MSYRTKGTVSIWLVNSVDIFEQICKWIRFAESEQLSPERAQKSYKHVGAQMPKCRHEGALNTKLPFTLIPSFAHENPSEIGSRKDMLSRNDIFVKF